LGRLGLNYLVILVATFVGLAAILIQINLLFLDVYLSAFGLVHVLLFLFNYAVVLVFGSWCTLINLWQLLCHIGLGDHWTTWERRSATGTGRCRA